jgi:formylmethanofuran dehydrogenase subunit A
VFQPTKKLKGSTRTMSLDEGSDFHICSFNFDVVSDTNNNFGKVATAYDVETELRTKNGPFIAIQGELICESI